MLALIAGRRGVLTTRAAALIACVALLLLSLPASAHLMVAQRGTLKLGKGGFFFVVSLPVSAFAGVDDDGNGRLSAKELRAHKADIEAAVRSGLVLESASEGPRLIEGLLLNLPHHHARAHKRGRHLVAMGRFSVASEDRALTLKMALFGKQPREQRFNITITRGDTKEVAVLTPAQPSHPLFATR